MDPKSAVVGDELDLAVVGGGAAGFFTALSCAEARPSSRIAIFEKGREVLSKVRISGGGRCNVTHACFAPRDLSTHYPRGQKELIGPFHRWGPKDTMRWFQHREVPLKTEDDGRVFPVSDRSESIIHCLLSQAQAANIEVRRGEPVSSVTSSDAGPFALHYPSGKKGSTQCLAITSGGLRGGKGADFLEAFGHEIVPPVPSLFTFKIKDPRIENLSGVSVADARVTVRLPSSKERLDASGPLLITHWGLSGPGILKLSAWGARLLHRQNYQFELEVN
ncbi:MAG: aminoacetone oxidase family FAD-binding enzyme, partial [Verrucomicrobiota bacterium]